VAGLAPNSEKTMLQPAALQVRLKFLCDVGRKVLVRIFGPNSGFFTNKENPAVVAHRGVFSIAIKQAFSRYALHEAAESYKTNTQHQQRQDSQAILVQRWYALDEHRVDEEA
jgi:hypothetical protein